MSGWSKTPVKKVEWINTHDGHTIYIPEGLGDNLRPLGWHPVGEPPAGDSEPTKPHASQAPSRPAARKQRTLK